MLYSISQKVGILLSSNPKALRRRPSSINRPRPTFQLFGVYCIPSYLLRLARSLFKEHQHHPHLRQLNVGAFWLFLSFGGPLCGLKTENQSPTLWALTNTARDFWKPPSDGGIRGSTFAHQALHLPKLHVGVVDDEGCRAQAHCQFDPLLVQGVSCPADTLKLHEPIRVFCASFAHSFSVEVLWLLAEGESQMGPPHASTSKLTPKNCTLTQSTHNHAPHIHHFGMMAILWVLWRSR